MIVTLFGFAIGLTSVLNTCDEFVSSVDFAIDNNPELLCCRSSWNWSSKFTRAGWPKPVPVGSKPWNTKPLMMRWSSALSSTPLLANAMMFDVMPGTWPSSSSYVSCPYPSTVITRLRLPSGICVVRRRLDWHSWR